MQCVSSSSFSYFFGGNPLWKCRRRSRGEMSLNHWLAILCLYTIRVRRRREESCAKTDMDQKVRFSKCCQKLGSPNFAVVIFIHENVFIFWPGRWLSISRFHGGGFGQDQSQVHGQGIYCLQKELWWEEREEAPIAMGVRSDRWKWNHLSIRRKRREFGRLNKGFFLISRLYCVYQELHRSTFLWATALYPTYWQNKCLFSAVPSCENWLWDWWGRAWNSLFDRASVSLCSWSVLPPSLLAHNFMACSCSW